MSSKAIFITGIDTDAGKTYATAFYAKLLAQQGLSVITQKFIQTGCVGFSEDIQRHRQLMGIGELPEDRDLTTAPQIFAYPSSPHLAAEMEGRKVDTEAIARATSTLLSRYDRVLIEGAGGLYVPITEDYFTIDYVRDHKLPAVLVTNGRLGSINHTLLSIAALRNNDIPIEAIIYNHYFDTDPEIAPSTLRFLQKHLPHTPILELPAM